MLIELPGAITLELLAKRAAFLPATSSLLIADLHLGKAQSFRRHAVPVPSGTTAAALIRIDKLLAQCAAREIIILGDFVHDAQALESDALERFIAWRARRPQLAIHLVRGNHDRHMGELSRRGNMEIHHQTLNRLDIVMRHEAETLAGESFVIAGHLHPVVRLAGAVDHVRLPCFWLRRQLLVLPAFGEFTGGWPVRRALSERIFATDGERVHELPELPESPRRAPRQGP